MQPRSKCSGKGHQEPSSGKKHKKQKTALLTNLMRRTLVSPASFPAAIVASRCAGSKYAGTYAKRRCSSSPAAKTTHVCRHDFLHKQLCAGVTMGFAGADVAPQRMS